MVGENKFGKISLAFSGLEKKEGWGGGGGGGG